MSDLFAELGGTDRPSREDITTYGSVSFDARRANKAAFERIAPLVTRWNEVGQVFVYQGKQYTFFFDVPTHDPKFKEVSLPIAEKKDKQGRAYWHARISDPLGYVSYRIGCRYVDEPEDKPWLVEQDFRKKEK